MNVALRKRNLDPVLPERLFNRKIQITPKGPGPKRHFLRPHPQLKVQGAVAEAVEVHLGLGIFQGVGMAAGDLQEQGGDFVDIAAIRDADGDAEAHLGIAVAPVHHGVGDELGVGDDDGDVVVGDHGGAAGADLAHGAGHLAHFHAVADLNGPLEKEDDAADEVFRDVLEPETESDADGAREDRQGGEVDPGVLHRNDSTDDEDHVADDLGDGVLQGAVQAAVGEEAIIKEALQPGGGPEDQGEKKQQPEDHQDAHAGAGQVRIPLHRHAARLKTEEQAAEEEKQAERGAEDDRPVFVNPHAHEPAPQGLRPAELRQPEPHRKAARKRRDPRRGDLVAPEGDQRRVEVLGERHRGSQKGKVSRAERDRQQKLPEGRGGGRVKSEKRAAGRPGEWGDGSL